MKKIALIVSFVLVGSTLVLAQADAPIEVLGVSLSTIITVVVSFLAGALGSKFALGESKGEQAAKLVLAIIEYYKDKKFTDPEIADIIARAKKLFSKEV